MSNNLVIKKDLSILIVEDEPIIALAVEANLKKIGYGLCSIATTPDNAILCAQNNYPDIVLMDINLNNANKNGIDVAKIIWRNLNIPIIFLTSYSSNKILDEALEAEPYAFLVKPCKEIDLKAAINTAIHKHKYFFNNKKNINKQLEEDNFIYIDKNMKFNKLSSEFYINDKLFPLTKIETKLFEILTINPGRIVSFETIFTYIWREDICELSKLRSLIYRLKSRLGENPFENIYEIGYRIKLIEADD
ncbi:response regulator [Campylobacterota bacterium DY0563]